MKNYEASRNITQNLEQELFKYYDDLMIIGNFNNQKDMFLQLSQYQTSKTKDQYQSQTFSHENPQSSNEQKSNSD